MHEMASLRLGKRLTDDEVKSIVTFLQPLTDKERDMERTAGL